MNDFTNFRAHAQAQLQKWQKIVDILNDEEMSFKSVKGTKPGKKHRTMSAASRKRISIAQKARWAAKSKK
jgi:hypothetical protein